MIHEHVSQNIKRYQTANGAGHYHDIQRDVEYTNPSDVIQRAIGLIFGVVEVALATRMVLSLLGVNTVNAFIQFIYTMTEPLVAPFYGIFGQNVEYGVSRLEFEVIIAMLVYALMGWLIITIINIAQDRR